jgi:SAM-dependent methyltransferase
MRLAFDLLQHPIAFETPRTLDARSAWLEHIPFAMFLVDLLRPDVLVELGAGAGDSYCVFCEAVDRLGLATRCYALEAWTAAGGPQPLADLRTHHDPMYGSFSQLLHGGLDEAAARFLDASVDLLHIRGSQAGGTARRAFDAWLPKMSPRGVILLHGIADREGDGGAWHAWEDIKRSYPSLEFVPAKGLGIVGVGAALPDSIRELLSLSEGDVAVVRRQFDRLGHRLRLLAELQKAERRLTEERDRRERDAAGLHADIERVRAEAAENQRAVDSLKAELRSAGRQIVDLQPAADQLRAVQGDAGQLRHEVDMLLGSLSWKLTAPVRRCADVLQTAAGTPLGGGRAWRRRGLSRSAASPSGGRRPAVATSRTAFIRANLICAECGRGLEVNGDDLVCSELHRWPVKDGVPLFLDSPASYVDRRAMLTATNPYNPRNLDLIRRNDWAFILDYGAGNPRDEEIFDNVIRVDFVHYRSVDVVTNTRRLPFRDGTFDFIVSESVFEHLRDPWHTAAELHRVLKPGGRICVDTAFLQPVHGDPYHFYNMTREGVEETFKMFRKVESGVGAHQSCGAAMNILFRYFLSLIDDDAAKTRLRDALGGMNFAQFDALIAPEKQHIMSAGIYFIGEKASP